MPDAPHIPGMIKPQPGKKIQMTFDEASRFIANDFFNSICRLEKCIQYVAVLYIIDDNCYFTVPSSYIWNGNCCYVSDIS